MKKIKLSNPTLSGRAIKSALCEDFLHAYSRMQNAPARQQTNSKKRAKIREKQQTRGINYKSPGHEKNNHLQ